MTRQQAQSFISIIPIILFIAVICLYSYSRARNVIFGPEISIISPVDGEVFENDLVILSGEIKNAAFITLNGRKIFVDEKNLFQEKLLLHYGYNIIEIEVVDRFNQKKKEELHLVYR